MGSKTQTPPQKNNTEKSSSALKWWKKRAWKLIQLTRWVPINPHPLHGHTAVPWESGKHFGVLLAVLGLGSVEARSTAGRNSAVCTWQCPLLFPFSSPLSLSRSLSPPPVLFSTRPGPLSLYLALKVGKGDITPLHPPPQKKPPSQPQLLLLSVPDNSKPNVSFFFDDWNLFHSNSGVAQVILSWLLISASFPLSVPVHITPTILSHILSLKAE